MSYVHYPEDYARRVEIRFWKKVEKTDYCWNWTGRLTKDRGRRRGGYAIFKVGSKHRKACHYSYEWHIGVIPKGLMVMHTCDNRRCVNPEHLKLGTHRDNMNDRNSKGRGPQKQDHCRRGHHIFGDNLYVSDGRNRCRACRTIRKKA